MPSPKAKPQSKRRRQNRADTSLDTLDLTPRRAAFVREYLVDLCAAKAARRAGFSEQQAKTASVQLLRDPWVREEIKEAMAARARRTEITTDRVLKEIARLAFVIPTDVLQITGADVQLRPTDDISPDDAAAIAGMRTTMSPTGERMLEVKFYDKLSSLKLLMQHLGMVGRVADNSATDDVACQIADDPDPEGRD